MAKPTSDIKRNNAVMPAAPQDRTSYTLKYTTPSYSVSDTYDTPTAVRDELARLRAEGLILRDITVTRGEEDDISGEFQ